jgi:hypothetical protein
MFIHDGDRFLQTQQTPAVAGFIVLGPPPFSAQGSYLLAIFRFNGISDISVVRGEGVAIPSIGSERAISTAIAQSKTVLAQLFGRIGLYPDGQIT